MNLLEQTAGIQPSLAWLLANVPPGLEEPLRTNAQRVLEELILKFGRLQGTVIESTANEPVQNSGLTLLVFNNGASPKEYADSVRQFFAETLVDLGEDELIEELIEKGVRELEAEGDTVEDMELSEFVPMAPDPESCPLRADPIKEKVVGLVSTCIGEPCVHMDYTLVDQLGFDSLDRTEFVILLEDEFKISIPDAESDKFRTVGDVVEYIKDNTL